VDADMDRQRLAAGFVLQSKNKLALVH
jgi:hypothetical protein